MRLSSKHKMEVVTLDWYRMSPRGSGGVGHRPVAFSGHGLFQIDLKLPRLDQQVTG